MHALDINELPSIQTLLGVVVIFNTKHCVVSLKLTSVSLKKLSFLSSLSSMQYRLFHSN